MFIVLLDFNAIDKSIAMGHPPAWYTCIQMIEKVKNLIFLFEIIFLW